MGRVGNTVMYIINIEFKSCFDFVVRTSFYGMQIATSHLIVCFRVANQIKTDFFFFCKTFVKSSYLTLNYTVCCFHEIVFIVFPHTLCFHTYLQKFRESNVRCKTFVKSSYLALIKLHCMLFSRNIFQLRGFIVFSTQCSYCLTLIYKNFVKAT